MNGRPHARWLAFLFLGGLTFSLPARNDDANVWRPIFDGASLDGWVRRGGAATYRVEEGAIVGTTAPDTPNTFLCTEQHYANFILELEFKVDPRLNSGVQIRSNSLPEYKDGLVHGYQVEIDPSDRAFTGGIYDEGTDRKWLCDLANNPPAREAFRQNEWNRFHVVANGQTLRTWLNGVPAAHLIDDKVASGFIALQVHGTKEKDPLDVRWRNLRIMELPADGSSTRGMLELPDDTVGLEPPPFAEVLLGPDGDLSHWRSAKDSVKSAGDLDWKSTDGALEVVPGAGDIMTTTTVRDFILHLEFNVADDPAIAWNLNGNSGVYIQRRYEVQILNSHGRQPTDQDCGALYRYRVPDHNAARPAGEWQTYDIAFRAARWDAAGNKIASARITVIHNGRTIHDDVELTRKTGQGDAEGPAAAPILLQDHKQRVAFRNIWLAPLEL